MTTYKIDPAHSEINFKVKHLMISSISGLFSDFDGEMRLENEDDLTSASVSFQANTASIQTKNEQRDLHLKSADFFDAEKFPILKFTSKKLEKRSEDEFELTGDLTLKDVTREIELDVVFNGKMTDPYGQEKLGFEISGKINRKDFGLTWSAVTETGGIVVGDDVKLDIHVQMTKQNG